MKRTLKSDEFYIEEKDPQSPVGYTIIATFDTPAERRAWLTTENYEPGTYRCSVAYKGETVED